jgi:hypothetical protein
LTITKEAHVTGFDVSLSLVLTNSRIRRAIQASPFNAIGSRVDGTTGPLARSRPLDTSRTSCPSTTTSKGYPGYRTAHIASIPITAVCSAGQHSEEKTKHLYSFYSLQSFYPSRSRQSCSGLDLAAPPSSKYPLLRVLQRACIDNSSRAPVSRAGEQRHRP